MWSGTNGWIAAGVFLGSVFAAAQATRVTIDVKPGDSPTTVERDRGGFLPVAVLSSTTFDALSIDVETIRIGPTGTEAAAARTTSSDVNQDKRNDLLVLVRVQDLNLKCTDNVIRLIAKTKDGTAIEGSETVKVSDCEAR